MLSDFQSAIRDFYAARRRARWELLTAGLTGRSAELLCLTEVQPLLDGQDVVKLGLRQIPLDAIVGSVNRCGDYTRSFLPRVDSDRQRWADVRQASRRPRGLPPIKVYLVADLYFVLDGHHRVSVAWERGWTHIEASVYEICSQASVASDAEADHLAASLALANLLERTRLDQSHPEADLRVSATGRVASIEAEIEAHRQFVAHAERRQVQAPEAAAAWYADVYRPAGQLRRDQQMPGRFPDLTEADLYLRLCEHRAALIDALGWEVEPGVAAADLMRYPSGRAQRAAAQARQRVRTALTPGPLVTGPRPGAWRNERAAAPSHDCLFPNILVPISSEGTNWACVAQAAELACREDSQLHGLHVAPAGSDVEGDGIAALRAEFARHCEVAGVSGVLDVAAGRAVHRICERSRWADLVVVGMARSPGERFFARLKSGFYTLLRRCATPVLVVPGAFSPLSRPLLAYDGGPKASEALFVAAYLATRGQVPLTVVSVNQDQLDAAAALDRAQVYLSRYDLVVQYVMARGPVDEAILRTAEAHDNDLILMGGYQRPPLAELLFGSAVNKVLAASRQPVLVCR